MMFSKRQSLQLRYDSTEPSEDALSITTCFVVTRVAINPCLGTECLLGIFNMPKRTSVVCIYYVPHAIIHKRCGRSGLKNA